MQMFLELTNTTFQSITSKILYFVTPLIIHNNNYLPFYGSLFVLEEIFGVQSSCLLSAVVEMCSSLNK